jgi:putative transposase
VQKRVRLSAAGQIARACWVAIPHYHPDIQLDAFVVMPDHLHGIVRLVDRQVAPHQRRCFGDAVPGSLATILGTYKAEVTKRINAQRHTPGRRVWQRNYYEHIVRNGADLERIRRYISTNPIRWKSN